MHGHDIVVVGGSAGALAPVIALVEGLGPGVRASLFIVIHAPEAGLGMTSEIIQRQTKWKVRMVEGPMPIRREFIYLPAPDHHLLLHRGRVFPNHGPRQNRFRPAIDPLFSSAALVYGPRVVGILLSGGMDDGVHGLRLIKQAGGITMVQDPSDSLAPELPLNALSSVLVDHALPGRQIGRVLEEVSREPARKARKTPASARRRARRFQVASNPIPRIPPAPFTCPECQGSLWRSNGVPVRYSCHVGHVFTERALMSAQREETDGHIWRAVRSLEEQAELHRRSARKLNPSPVVAARVKRHAADLERQAFVLRRILIEKDLHPPRRVKRQAGGRLRTRT